MSAWATYPTASGARRRSRQTYWLIAVAAAAILGIVVVGQAAIRRPRRRDLRQRAPPHRARR